MQCYQWRLKKVLRWPVSLFRMNTLVLWIQLCPRQQPNVHSTLHCGAWYYKHLHLSIWISWRISLPFATFSHRLFAEHTLSKPALHSRSQNYITLFSICWTFLLNASWCTTSLPRRLEYVGQDIVETFTLPEWTCPMVGKYTVFFLKSLLVKEKEVQLFVCSRDAHNSAFKGSLLGFGESTFCSSNDFHHVWLQDIPVTFRQPSWWCLHFLL